MSHLASKLRFLINKTPILNQNIVQALQTRNYCFRSSGFVVDLPETKVKYETTADPNDWKYVERVLPLSSVPKPTVKQEYPSKWQPQTLESLKKPYFIERNKNHMMPVYMKTGFRGMRRLTFVRKIRGDIWLLEKELREHVQKISVKPVRLQVNEFAGYICIHGDHVNYVKDWLLQKGF